MERSGSCLSGWGLWHVHFSPVSILVSALWCGRFRAEINKSSSPQCYSGSNGSPHLLLSSRISLHSRIILGWRIQLIRCYWLLFSRWKTRGFYWVWKTPSWKLHHHLKGGKPKEKKKQGKEQIDQSLLRLKTGLGLQVKMKFMLSVYSFNDRLLTMQTHHLMEYDWQSPLKKELWLEKQSLIQVRLEVCTQSTEGFEKRISTERGTCCK